MRSSISAFAIAVVASLPAAASDKDEVKAVVQQWVEGFNKGDMKSALANCADQVAIIDVFPPYEWHGAHACSRWWRDYKAGTKKFKMSGGTVTLSDPTHLTISGDRAYITSPASFTFKVDGQSKTEDNLTFALVLQKTTAVWHTRGWAWVER